MNLVLPEEFEHVRPEGRRRALVVCNGTFACSGLPTLAGVERDFANMSRVLAGEEADFEVTGLFDGTLIEQRKAVAKICAESGEDDTLLLYFGGNSFLSADGSLYILANDSEKEFADATALDTDFILAQLRRSRCRRTVVLVDGCNAGAFFRNNRGIPDGLYFIGACGPDQATADTSKGGAFTLALLRALEDPKTDKDGDGWISVDELHESVKARMGQSSSFGATPYKWICGVDRMIYVAKAMPRVFVSYCREDVDMAQRIKLALEERGFGVWLDLEGIRSGNWKERVIAALQRSRAVLFIMSNQSLRAEAVKKELDFASREHVPMIPLVVEQGGLQIPNWYDFDFADIHRHEFGARSFDEVLNDLALAIRQTRPGTAQAAEPATR